MEDQFQLLFENMKTEMHTQIADLKDSIINTIMEKVEVKLQIVKEENKELKIKTTYLEKEIEILKRENKRKNIIIFGVKEEEKTIQELSLNVKKIFEADLNIIIQKFEINKIYRIGKNNSGEKPRPILLSFVSEWKKNELMKSKKNLKDIYITEDYTKEVLEKRKALQSQLIEERKKGNLAFLKYDKLIVKEGNRNQEKRKREISTSPRINNQPRKQQSLMSSKNNNKVNAFDLIRARSNSLSSCTSVRKQ